VSEDLVTRLNEGHDRECAMSYGMHERCCDCSFPARQAAAAEIGAHDHVTRLRQAELNADNGYAVDAELVGDVADEIERLLAERDAWEATAQGHYKEAFDLRALLKEARESWIRVGYGASHEDVAECRDFCDRIDAMLRMGK